MWDENGGKEETERVTVMKRKWEREWEKERERVMQNEDKRKELAQLKALGQRTDCRRAMVDTREELLLHRESEWSDR